MILACGFGDNAGCDVESTLEETTRELDDQFDEMEREATVIDESGGVAESSDGRMRVRFPPGALDEALRVNVDVMPDYGREYPHFVASPNYGVSAVDAETYGVTDALENLGESVVVEIDVDAPSGNAHGWIHAPQIERDSEPGILGHSEMDGDVVSAELSALTATSYSALVFEMRDECAEIEKVGTPCEEGSDTCIPDSDFVCICEDEETSASLTFRGEIDDDHCEGGVCNSLPIQRCSGFPSGGGGACATLGGWTGDCYLAD